MSAWSPDGERIGWFAAPPYTFDDRLYVADASDLVPSAVPGLEDVTCLGTMAGRRIRAG